MRVEEYRPSYARQEPAVYSRALPHCRESALSVSGQQSIRSEAVMAVSVRARAAASPGLPAPMRADTPASGARDYSGMSDAEFRRIKESYRRAAQNGMHVRL